MSQYYFMVASLPLLTYENAAPIRSEEFLDIARANMRPGDVAKVIGASIDAPQAVACATPAERAWRVYERGLRNVLVRARGARRAIDAGQYIRTDYLLHDETERAGLEELAREATSAPSPLTGEDLLNRARWDELESLTAGHSFDVEHVVLYYLKLQLLERRGKFTRDQGEPAFQLATESIMNDYYEGQE